MRKSPCVVVFKNFLQTCFPELWLIFSSFVTVFWNNDKNLLLKWQNKKNVRFNDVLFNFFYWIIEHIDITALNISINLILSGNFPVNNLRFDCIYMTTCQRKKPKQTVLNLWKNSGECCCCIFRHIVFLSGDKHFVHM